MRHSGCHLAENSPLGEHYKASCATFIPHQTRRNDPRYIAPSASLSNEQQLIQSRKRKLSASASLDKDTEDANKMIRPVSGLVDRAKVREITDSFSTNVMVSIKLCAVTGSGRRWCTGQRIGPSLEVCQIVPSQHFHVYPTGDNSQDMGRRLVQAWHDIWDFKNGFLLRSDIRELFDARLISIYPDTHRIRAFVPYDVTLKYHGRIATIPRNVDRDALAHHYEMACIENMTAMMPIRGSTTLPSTVVRGPFLLPTAHADLPAPPGQPSRSPRRLATGSTAQGLTRPSTP
ncbi:hypothetical protein NW768_010861 [Fusarium equiseti]|uniref:HNH nuclease domain-containing protein n=1 Tax=Fusarium equiseti TaxID=61235 RepID=A0ABQ8QYX1_FUSEQ|nr:hypothetical protein NW768_010861 [Fusarium equiseti]